VSVERVLALGPDQLKTAGLSRAKAEAMVGLAEGVAANRIALASHGRMRDAEVVADVSSVRGIGPWTAQMYLMFTLARPDVWPVGDYGVRSGWTVVHGLDEIVNTVELQRAGADFEGVRSALAWYCWRAMEPA
jgi:3-methyladenine DNA glycosylase/8-oxoguanine DNA glycosylase